MSPTKAPKQPTIVGLYFLNPQGAPSQGRILSLVDGKYAHVAVYSCLTGSYSCDMLIGLHIIASDAWQLYEDHETFLAEYEPFFARREAKRKRENDATPGRVGVPHQDETAPPCLSCGHTRERCSSCGGPLGEAVEVLTTVHMLAADGGEYQLAQRWCPACVRILREKST